MVSLSLRARLTLTKLCDRRGLPRASLEMRRRSPLYLEVLEGRCLPSTVTNLTDHDPGSLRDAIATTPADGTIDFEPLLNGTITLTSGTLTITKDLAIAPAPYLAGSITVSGNHMFQVFNIAPSITITISGLTIADGVPPSLGDSQGGGMYNAGTLNLDDVVLLGNSARTGGYSQEGGGIFNSSSGTLTINSSTVWGNTAVTGGGIYNNGTLRMSNSIVSDNRLSYYGDGAGIYNGGTLTLDHSTISGNTSTSEALSGGISNVGTLTITDSTISNNAAYFGGGIKSGGTLTISDSTISGNYAQDGGGIVIPGGTVAISNTLLTNNVAEYAGTMLIYSGSVTLSNSTISGNRGQGGETVGGNLINTGTLAIINSTISGNTGTFSAGGIDNFGTLTITSSTISGNGGQTAGGIENYGTAMVSNSTISGNGSGMAGGIQNSGTLTVSNSTISENTGGDFAGGIANVAGYDHDANVVLINCTIVDNRSSGNFLRSGNQLYSGRETGTGNATIQLRNTIISGDDSSPNFFADVGGSFVSRDHNLSSDNANGFLTGSGDLINVNPLLGPLQDNGGPTQTMALLPGSPAIDAGDNSLVPSGVTSDQRGAGFNRIADGTVDIGAFEAQASTTVAASVNTSIYGQTVTFTATVSSEGQSPSAGTILFRDGNTVLAGPITVWWTGSF
jgi:Right handed beta helix region